MLKAVIPAKAGVAGMDTCFRRACPRLERGYDEENRRRYPLLSGRGRQLAPDVIRSPPHRCIILSVQPRVRPVVS